MSLAAGDRLGPFEIVGKLGAGGMGEVYRARDSKLKREVAIKVLPADVATDRERLARFQREAEVLASLNHPHIAQVYGIEEGALVMELVDGEDLSQRIARGAIPIDEALPIAQQIAEALEAAHDAGIVHRDLKPANIKLRSDGTVKVLDFGLAKAIDRLDGDGFSRRPEDTKASSLQTITTPAMTMHGVILGTAAYMSPEQAKGKAVDKRADIWAFGCVLFEMLTGKRAFKGDDATDVITSVMRDTPDWNALPPTTPRQIRTLLSRCLEKDPRRRLRDIGDAHYQLAHEPIEAPTATMARSSRMPALASATIACSLLAVALLAYPAVSHWRETPTPSRPLRMTIDAPPRSVRLLSPEVSPDGRAMAFGAIQAGMNGPQFWIRRFDEIAPRMIPLTIPGSGPPFWSPDGQLVAYPSAEGLVEIDLRTNVTRVIAKFGTTLGGLARFLGTWSAERGIVFGLGSRIYRIPHGGSEPQAIAFEGLPIDADNRFPLFLPDGRHILSYPAMRVTLMSSRPRLMAGLSRDCCQPIRRLSTPNQHPGKVTSSFSGTET